MKGGGLLLSCSKPQRGGDDMAGHEFILWFDRIGMRAGQIGGRRERVFVISYNFV